MTPLDSLRHQTGQVEKKMVYYIYVLRSEKDGNFYTGYTFDLKKRMSEHNNGKVRSTSFRRPFSLVYFESCLNQQDALHREKYLKTAWGKRYIKSRIKNYLLGQVSVDSKHQTGQGVKNG